MKREKTTKASRSATRAEKRLVKHGPKAKISFKRHIVPPVLGIVVALAVLLGMNGQWLLAQLKYRFSQPTATTNIQTVAATSSNGTTTATDTKSPHPELGPQLSLPAISTTAPIEFDQGTAEWQIQLGLRKGVVHYDGSAKPGETGNVAIFGHSSGQPWAPGKYKFVFTLLDKLKANDLIYLDYQGTRYTYKVTTSQVVTPTDTGVLNSSGDHELTLITCTPVGTSTNRLVVHAEQISPIPAKATGAASTNGTPNSLKTLPGTAH